MFNSITRSPYIRLFTGRKANSVGLVRNIPKHHTNLRPRTARCCSESTFAGIVPYCVLIALLKVAKELPKIKNKSNVFLGVSHVSPSLASRSSR